MPVSCVNWSTNGVMPSVQGCWLARNVISVPLYFFQSNAAADAAAPAVADAAAPPLGEALGDPGGGVELGPCPAQAATNIVTAGRDNRRAGFRLVISLPPPAAQCWS